MSIHVAPELLGRVFFVPKSIVDEHLAYVNGQQLKVLLYVLRHTGEDLEVQDLAGLCSTGSRRACSSGTTRRKA